jgi:hypothetical protein
MPYAAIIDVIIYYVIIDTTTDTITNAIVWDGAIDTIISFDLLSTGSIIILLLLPYL